ncbi:hypothetical protein ACMDCT_15185 [Halomonadaceae bacterium KBTZ08]
MTDNRFSEESALSAAEALQQVLARRTHKRRVLGEERIIPGQLGEALGLPDIIQRLQSRNGPVREKALARFEAIWETLSERSRQRVRLEVGWYDPRELDWEDPRSNRRPLPDH